MLTSKMSFTDKKTITDLFKRLMDWVEKDERPNVTILLKTEEELSDVGFTNFKRVEAIRHTIIIEEYHGC